MIRIMKSMIRSGRRVEGKVVTNHERKEGRGRRKRRKGEVKIF